MIRYPLHVMVMSFFHTTPQISTAQRHSAQLCCVLCYSQGGFQVMTCRDKICPRTGGLSRNVELPKSRLFDHLFLLKLRKQ